MVCPGFRRSIRAKPACDAIAITAGFWYTFPMRPAAKEILEKVARWPEEDQQGPAELALDRGTP